MLKLWMIKGPLQFLFVALISFPVMAQFWFGMSWFTVAFVLILGCSVAMLTYIPSSQSGDQQGGIDV